MFAGERTAVADYQICGFFYKLSIVGDALFGLQIEIDPHVDAGVAKMSIESSTVAVAFHQLEQIAKVDSKFFGSDSSILPSLPTRRFVGHVGSGAQSRFADVPGLLHLELVGEQTHVRRVGSLA